VCSGDVLGMYKPFDSKIFVFGYIYDPAIRSARSSSRTFAARGAAALTLGAAVVRVATLQPGSLVYGLSEW
jgi:hypothetical protein